MANLGKVVQLIFVTVLEGAVDPDQAGFYTLSHNKYGIQIKYSLLLQFKPVN